MALVDGANEPERQEDDQEYADDRPDNIRAVHAQPPDMQKAAQSSADKAATLGV